MESFCRWGWGVILESDLFLLIIYIYLEHLTMGIFLFIIYIYLYYTHVHMFFFLLDSTRETFEINSKQEKQN